MLDKYLKEISIQKMKYSFVGFSSYSLELLGDLVTLAALMLDES